MFRDRAERIGDHQHNRNREIPTDWQELATFRENDDVVDALDEATRQRITAIVATLGRMDEGIWSTCQLCEEEIAEKRLEAVPTVAICVRCATEQEEERGAL